MTLDQFYPKVAEILPALEHPVKVLIARIRDELKAPLRYAFIMTKGRKLPKLPNPTGTLSGTTSWRRARRRIRSLPPHRRLGARGRGDPLFRRHHRHHQGHPALQPQLQRPGIADRGHERLYRPARHEDALGDAHFPRLRTGYRHPHGAGGGRDLHTRAPVHHQHLRQAAEKEKAQPHSRRADAV